MSKYLVRSFIVILLVFLVACSTVEDPARKNVEIIYHESDETDETAKQVEIVKPEKLEETDEITIISRDTTQDMQDKETENKLPPPPETPEQDAEVTPPITKSGAIDLYAGQTIIIQHSNKNYKLRMTGVINNKTAKVTVNEDTKLFTVGSHVIIDDLKFDILALTRNAPYELPGDQVQLHLLTDKGLLTVFLEDGQKKTIRTSTREFLIEAMAITSFRDVPIVKLKVNERELSSMAEDDIEYISPELQIYVADLFLNEKETGKRDLIRFDFSKTR